MDRKLTLATLTSEVRGLIAAGEWRPAALVPKLADEHGVSEGDVLRCAIDAHRANVACRDSIDDESSAALQGIMATKALASRAKKAMVVAGTIQYVDAPDFKAMLSCDMAILTANGTMARVAKGDKPADDAPDLRAIVLEEMRTNPAFAKQALSMLTPADIRKALTTTENKTQ